MLGHAGKIGLQHPKPPPPNNMQAGWPPGTAACLVTDLFQVDIFGEPLETRPNVGSNCTLFSALALNTGSSPSGIDTGTYGEMVLGAPLV